MDDEGHDIAHGLAIVHHHNGFLLRRL
jgi:hypothetical protein